jgi:hypothetical protein
MTGSVGMPTRERKVTKYYIKNNPVLRIRDVYPGSCFLPIPDPGSRIPDPKTAKNYFIFEKLKKKIWANFQRIIELFTQKIVTKLSKILVWDRRSGIRKKPIPDPGSRGQKSPDPDPDPPHCNNLYISHIL